MAATFRNASGRLARIGVILGVTVLSSAPALAACDDLKTRGFDAARAGRYDDAITLVLALGKDATCSADDISRSKLALATFIVQKAVETGDSKPYSPAYASLVQKADQLNAFWQASARLGDVHVANKRFGDAASAYQRAINLLDLAGKPVAAGERKYVVQRAEETRQLAAERGNGDNKALFVAMQPNHRGETGGEYGAGAGRGITGEKVPTPIVFQYNSDQFTPEGAQYAAELLDVLKKVQPARITIVGHTDQRGTDEYNQVLSERRALAVVAYLKTNGLSAAYTAQGMGKREPRAFADASVYGPAEIDALNRRVETSWGQ